MLGRKSKTIVEAAPESTSSTAQTDQRNGSHDRDASRFAVGIVDVSGKVPVGRAQGKGADPTLGSLSCEKN